MSDIATETVNEQLEIPVVTEAQKKRIQFLCAKVNRNEITKNEAFRYSKADGDNEDDKGFKGTYKEWMDVALANGLVEKPQEIVAPEPEKKPTNWIAPICIGIGVGILLIIVAKKYASKQ